MHKERLAELPDFIPTILEIPESLWYNTRNETFFRIVSGSGNLNRYIIFLSDFQKNILNYSTTWVIDGIFKSVPNHFYQLITIQERYLGRF